MFEVNKIYLWDVGKEILQQVKQTKGEYIITDTAVYDKNCIFLEECKLFFVYESFTNDNNMLASISSFVELQFMQSVGLSQARSYIDYGLYGE